MVLYVNKSEFGKILLKSFSNSSLMKYFFYFYNQKNIPNKKKDSKKYFK